MHWRSMQARVAALAAALMIAVPAATTFSRQQSDTDSRTSGSLAVDRHLAELDKLVDTLLEEAPGETVTLSRTRLEEIDFHVEQIQQLLLVQP